MKFKILTIIIAATLLTLSFTFASKSSDRQPKKASTTNEPIGGFAAEDER